MLIPGTNDDKHENDTNVKRHRKWTASKSDFCIRNNYLIIRLEVNNFDMQFRYDRGATDGSLQNNFDVPCRN